ncbi:MAG: hypothetical protein SF187_20415 [Deltaproteobacteria bacterium]|nr:hypothetical protein [Deltaproteobacteria bacterium]
MELFTGRSCAFLVRARFRQGLGAAVVLLAMLGSVGAAHAKAQTIAARSAPGPVLATLNKVLGQALPKNIEKEKKDGAVLYTAKFKAEGHKRSVQIAENGEVVRTQTTLLEAELPEAVRKAVNARYAKAEIKKCKAVFMKTAQQPTFYKIELGGKLKKTKLKLDPQGQPYKAN